MLNRNRNVFFVAIALLTASCETTPTPPVSLEMTIAVFAKAFSFGDYETVEAHIAEEYVHVNGAADPFDRAQWLDWYKGYAAEIRNGDHVFEDYTVMPVAITGHGDAAYVTGIVHTAGTRHGEAFAQRIRFTNLWVIEEGRWKRAGFQDAASNE